VQLAWPPKAAAMPPDGEPRGLKHAARERSPAGHGETGDGRTTTMTATMETPRRLLDPAVLARITGLEFRARMVVEGFVSGMHRSPYRGFSVEFAEHRKYSQGDDLRHLDWRVLGRTDRYYVKQHSLETNLQLMLLVDASASMRYRSQNSGLSKRDYAGAVAAAMAYLALHQADAVGLAMLDSHGGRVVRASNNPAQWKALVREMEETFADNGTTGGTPVLRGPNKQANLSAMLDHLADVLTRRHVVVVLSDLFEDVPEVLGGLARLRHRRHEVIVFHVMDHAELTLPFSQPTCFVGLEDDGLLRTHPRLIRQRYLREVRGFINRVQAGCRQRRIDHELLDTSRPLDRALAGFLAVRAARVRARGG
jgi:uncharacterized protein (DUF58 family)